MKTVRKFTTFLIIGFVFLMGIELHAQENLSRLEIQPKEVEIATGESIQLQAVFIDSNDVSTDTSASWSMVPDSLGTISSTGLFQAEAEGKGYIYASLGDLQDSVEFEVEEPSYSLPALVIEPHEFEISLGDSIQLQAYYVDSSETMTDTTVSSWTVSPDSLGTISANGWFTATAYGKGTISAQLDTLEGFAEFEIEKDEPEGPGEGNRVVVIPSDTVAQVGSTIQFSAKYFVTPDSLVDTTATWSMRGVPLGTLSSTGELTLDTTGFALVDATVGSYTGSAFVVSSDSTADTTGVQNSITITRDSPNPQGYSVMQTLVEGEVWVMGGMPHPMNVLNGGGVYFPHGSLSEDVRIHISLPGFAHVTGDSLTFQHHSIVTGVDFQVMVNDKVSEPYYFETPLIVGLPFKRGLLRHLNIDPTTLGLYFATTSNDSIVFDSTGIEYTTVDSSRNRIFSSVAHFSSLVVRGSSSATSVSGEPGKNVPAGYALSQNYPNPFNPETQIQYTIPTQTDVRVTVYNSLGQRVKTLVNTSQQAGTYQVVWNGTNQSGTRVASGMYFYRLETEDFVQMKKMVLLR